MDHAELAAEMAQIDKIPTPERIRQAKKRRAQQLKRYAQWSKTVDKKARKVRDLTGEDPDRRVKFSQNIVLLEAAARNDVDEVRSLLKSGVNPNAANEDGLTALHQCCIDNSETMCRLLLEFNADVNARDTEQWTPLHAAATCGHLGICRLLVNNGAELLSVNADGNMPYDICEESATLDYIEGEMAKRGITQQQIDDTRLVPEKRMLQDLMKAFEQAPSKPACRQLFDRLDSQGANLLHVACANGFLSAVTFLLDQARVPLDTRDKDGWLPVHIAACWGQPEIIEALAVRGADLEAKTEAGETVHDMCEDPQMKERLENIKKEVEQKRLTRVPSVKGPTRKPSMTRGSDSSPSNGSGFSRTASVRRSSMREKSMMSRKEARQEAQLLPFLTPDEDTAAAAAKDPQSVAIAAGVTIDPATAAAAAKLEDVTISIPVPSSPPPQQQQHQQPYKNHQQQHQQQQHQQPYKTHQQQQHQQQHTASRGGSGSSGLKPTPTPPPPLSAYQQGGAAAGAAAPTKPIMTPSSRFHSQPNGHQSGSVSPSPSQQQQQQQQRGRGGGAPSGGADSASTSGRMRFAGTAGDTDLVVGERPKRKMTCCSVQ
ncbi:hypothetical protein BOX15_Mlig000739g2 [Macrostomum lignano]|uniref:Uncharacterized protein n=1 Tax=Macrostomum lignano TaxID=282301 RepID=A0A267ELB6_9PLAT|nr:hypothetical protein BOX15_Mlig000739g2 [Macrostomum lignano]